jgi:hypothetical protein
MGMMQKEQEVEEQKRAMEACKKILRKIEQ